MYSCKKCNKFTESTCKIKSRNKSIKDLDRVYQYYVNDIALSCQSCGDTKIVKCSDDYLEDKMGVENFTNYDLIQTSNNYKIWP